MMKLAFLGLLAVTHLSAADPRIGSWKLVSAQSSLTPPNKLSVIPEHDAIHVVLTGETHVDFTAKTDGHETAVQGNPGFNRVDLHKIDKFQTEIKEKKDGAVVATMLDKLSPDAKELTITTSEKNH